MLKIIIEDAAGVIETEIKIDPATATEDDIQAIADDIRFHVEQAKNEVVEGRPPGEDIEKRFERKR